MQQRNKSGKQTTYQRLQCISYIPPCAPTAASWPRPSITACITHAHIMHTKVNVQIYTSSILKDMLSLPVQKTVALQLWTALFFALHSQQQSSTHMTVYVFCRSDSYLTECLVAMTHAYVRVCTSCLSPLPWRGLEFQPAGSCREQKAVRTVPEDGFDTNMATGEGGLAHCHGSPPAMVTYHR